MTYTIRDLNIKWFATGFGQSMSFAEIYVAYKDNSDAIVVSRRSVKSKNQPTVATVQNAVIVPESTATLSNGVWYVTFTRPTAATTGNNGVEVDITRSAQNMILAYGSTVTGTGISASLSTHRSSSIGTGVVDLYANVSAFDASVLTSLGAVSGSSSQSFDFYLAHGILMFLAWQVCAPLSIAIARFFKTKLGPKWFKIHVGLGFVGVGFLTAIGFALAYEANPDALFSTNGSSSVVYHNVSFFCPHSFPH